MPLGGLKGSTPIPNIVIPQAVSSYDPITRRKVRFIETIVPTLQLGESSDTGFNLADRYYLLVGQGSSPLAWCQSINSISVRNWDATEQRFYARGSSGAGAANYHDSGSARHRLFHYGGVSGIATDHAPKNTSVTKAILEFRARFNANADYTTYGVGALNGDGTANDNLFATATMHFIQVTRNTTAWELGTCDGATISQSSGGTGDGSWHDFKVEWDDAQVVLFVDGVSTITKTTNRPSEPLAAAPILAQNNTNTIDVIDYLWRWE